jgi:hypothetical protein
MESAFWGFTSVVEVLLSSPDIRVNVTDKVGRWEGLL